MLAFAQPLTQSELAWGTSSGTLLGGVQSYFIYKNTTLTNQLIGSSSPKPITFAIDGAGPYSGTVSGLAPLTGWNLYTPNNNFVGNDQFVYDVNGSALGLVGISVVDTNSITNGCTTWYFTNQNNVLFCASPANNQIVWSMQDKAPSFGGGLQGVGFCINTNFSWTFAMTDSMSFGLATNWFYTNGTDPTLPLSWNANLVSGSQSDVYFESLAVNPNTCQNLNGDIYVATLCPVLCAYNITNTSYASSGNDNFGPPATNWWAIGGNWTSSANSDLVFSWLNLTGTTKTLSMKGVYNWNIPASGLAEIQVKTNGVVEYDTIWPSTSGSSVSNYLISIPPQNPPSCFSIDVREHIIYGGTTVTIIGSFTNTIQ